MPPVARYADSFRTGHGCTPISTITAPSTDVIANGRGVERRGDPSVPHTVNRGSSCVPHVVKITGGSSTVIVNGRRCARIGDSIDAGAIISGSPDVIAGG